MGANFTCIFQGILPSCANLFAYIHTQMKTKIRYTETSKQVLGIIIIPPGYIGVFSAIIFSIDLRSLSASGEALLIFGGIMVAMAASVFTIFRLVMAAGEAYLYSDSLKITLLRATPLFPHREMDIPLSNVADAGFNVDPGKGVFISLHTKIPAKSLLIFPDKYHESEAFTAFWEALQHQIQAVNRKDAGSSGKIILGKSFYDSPLMRVLAWASVAAAITGTILYRLHPAMVSGGKLIGFYCYAIPFCYLVFGNRAR